MTTNDNATNFFMYATSFLFTMLDDVLTKILTYLRDDSLHNHVS